MNARHNANKRLGAGHPTVAIGVKSKRTTEENTRYQNKDLLILLLHNNSLFPIHFIQLVKSVQDCSTLVQNLWHGCPCMMLLIVVHAINPNYGCLFTVCIPWTARHAGKRLWLVPYAGTLDGDGDGVHLIVVNILVTTLPVIIITFDWKKGRLEIATTGTVLEIILLLIAPYTRIGNTSSLVE